jgi:hypothetical protein
MDGVVVPNCLPCLPNLEVSIRPGFMQVLFIRSNHNILCCAYAFCSGIAALHFSLTYNTIIRKYSFCVLFCFVFVLIGPRPADPRAHVELGMLAHIICIPLGLADVCHRRVLVLFLEAIVDTVLILLDALGFLHATQ